MSKIKYATFSLKSKTKQYFKGNEIDKFEEFMEKLSKKYKIEKPVIKDIELDFDYLNVILNNNQETYIITFDYYSSNLLFIKRKDKKIYDVLEKIDNTPFIIKRVFENKAKETKIEKIYTKDEKDNYTYFLNEIPYIMYIFQYKNHYLESKIKLCFPKSINFQSNLFMKYIVESQDIKTIEVLYEKIKDFILNKDNYIEISNNINLEFPEKIIINNGELVEYKKNIKTNEEEKYLNYHNNKLFITKKENPITNENINQIKKIIKK